MGEIITFPTPENTPEWLWTNDELLYVIIALTARRVMLPVNTSLDDDSIGVRRSDLALVISQTDDGIGYISTYYDYEQAYPRQTMTAWKYRAGTSQRSKKKIVKFKSVFHDIDGDPLKTKEAICALDSCFSGSYQMFDGLVHSHDNPSIRSQVYITQLLFAANKDKAARIIKTWDSEHHRITACGPEHGGHPLLDWDQIRELQRSHSNNLTFFEQHEEEFTEAAQIGVR